MEENPFFSMTLFLKVHQERDSETRIKGFCWNLFLSVKELDFWI